jgi:hypothetical protein
MSAENTNNGTTEYLDKETNDEESKPDLRFAHQQVEAIMQDLYDRGQKSLRQVDIVNEYLKYLLQTENIEYEYSDKQPNVHKALEKLIKDGKVIKTEPSTSTSVPVGTTVKIYVSFTTEATRVYVPGLVGYKEDIARQTLLNAQLYYFSVRYEYDDFVEKGYVISQSIEKETIVDVSEEIIIVVSLGSVADAIANGTYMPQDDQSTAFDDYYDTGE